MLAVELLVTGLMTGSFYALVAMGLSLIFGILKVVNFAHGEFFMAGAYIYTLLSLERGVDVWAALGAAAAGGALLGYVTERTLMRPLYARYQEFGAARDEYAIIVTFGLSLLLMNAANQLFGPFPFKGPELTQAGRMAIAGMLLSPHRLVASLVAWASLALTLLVLRFTFWGKQVRALAQNRFGAAIAGIDHARASAHVFALSGALASLSGGLLAPLFHAYPMVGTLPAVKSYAIVVLGGMGSAAGSVIGGLLLGVLESFGAVYVSYAYRDTFAFVVLILVLLFMPRGLLGETVREV